MNTCFNGKNYKSKKRPKNYKTLTTILKLIDKVVNIGATTKSVTLSVTGVGLIVVPNSAGVACGLSLANKVLPKMI